MCAIGTGEFWLECKRVALLYLVQISAKAKKIEYLSNTEFPGTENVKLSCMQTGYNYKQKDLTPDLVMQGCKRVVCKFDIQRGQIVYIQQSANY